MSAFLGPIHHWLFKKIKIVESRRSQVITALQKRYGDEVTHLIEELEKEYGEKIEGRPLEEMVGENPIHGFLQAMIAKVEVGEGRLAAAVINKYKGDGFHLLLEETEKHGRETGKTAIQEKSLKELSPKEVHATLNDYFLQGMPCDHVTTASPRSNKLLELQHSRCLHKGNWGVAGAPFMEMCCFANIWIGGFVQAVKPGMRFERHVSVASGGSGCLAEFSIY